MSSHKRMKGGILAGNDAFRFFLWRQRPLQGALKGYVPDILASDGRRVRRIFVGRRFLSMQEYDDARCAEAIADMVQQRSPGSAGLRGYSLYSEHEAVAIWHYEGEKQPAWVAFPFTDLPGRAAVVANLPGYSDGVARLRLCGGTRLRWTSGRLVLEAAIEQRSDGYRDQANTRDMMDYIAELRLETTVEKDAEARPVRMTGRGEAVAQVRRTGTRRVEACWTLNAAIYEQFRDNPTLKAWFVIKFESDLFCLPDPWREWWFEVEFPGQVNM